MQIVGILSSILAYAFVVPVLAVFEVDGQQVFFLPLQTLFIAVVRSRKLTGSD